MNVHDFNRALILSSRLYPLLNLPYIGSAVASMMAMLCMSRCRRLESAIDLLERAEAIRKAESC